MALSPDVCRETHPRSVVIWARREIVAETDFISHQEQFGSKYLENNKTARWRLVRGDNGGCSKGRVTRLETRPWRQHYALGPVTEDEHASIKGGHGDLGRLASRAFMDDSTGVRAV